MIARAELARSSRSHEPRAVDEQPDLVPASGLNRPKGLAAVIDTALGPVDLPALFELQSALASVEERLRASGDAGPLPELNDVVVAVLAEERDKISRYIDVRDL
jgi:hypothetical protein